MSRRIGIAMAVYQPVREHFLLQLESIQNQTYRNWFAVLNFDSPIEIFKSDILFEKFRKDDRFIWVQNKSRLGVKRNFESAIEFCAQHGAELIACSDQDDIWYADKLAVCNNELSKRPPLSLVHSDMHVLVSDKDQLPKTAWELERRGVDHVETHHLLVRNVVAGAAMLFDAELAKRYPVIPEGVPFHDHWIAIVASAHGGVYPIAQPLYAYRQHASNVLGVTEFVSTFSLKRIGRSGIAEKCLKVFKNSKALAQSAQQFQILKSGKWDLVFLKPYDLGLGYLLMGLSNFSGDRALSRACFGRALGKCLSVLGRS